MRFIYGVGAPMLVVMVLILALVLSPSYWLVGITLVTELAFLALIITKLMAIMRDPDEEK